MQNAEWDAGTQMGDGPSRQNGSPLEHSLCQVLGRARGSHWARGSLNTVETEGHACKIARLGSPV